ADLWRSLAADVLESGAAHARTDGRHRRTDHVLVGGVRHQHACAAVQRCLATPVDLDARIQLCRRKRARRGDRRPADGGRDAYFARVALARLSTIARAFVRSSARMLAPGWCRLRL